MLVVLPFHAGDKAQAVSLANWIRELGQVSEHKALICLGDHCEESGVIEPLRECFGSVSVFRPNAKAKRGEGKMGYARAANAMWQSVAWKVYFQESNQGKKQVPWLWLEPDAIPTRPSWLREIESEYKAWKKPFMGAKGQSQIDMLNGVAVYPAAVCDYAPLALQAGDCPWDLNAAQQILKYAVVSELFQHIYQIEGEAPTFPKHRDRLTNAALFHRSKDGSLIAYLKEHGYTTTSREASGLQPSGVTAQQTERASEERSPSRIVADDSEMLGESVDYAERLEEEARRHPVKPKVPNEGDRMGELVWRQGKWHTATDVVEPTVANRAAVMEKYKHPEKNPDYDKASHKVELHGPGLDEEKHLSGDGQNLPAVTRDKSGAKGEAPVSTQTPSRDDLVKDAVSVLKSLCTSPRAKKMIRAELKKQKVVAK